MVECMKKINNAMEMKNYEELTKEESEGMCLKELNEFKEMFKIEGNELDMLPLPKTF